ncbi:MAG: shikimate kinase [Spirochaetaceae bacterium]
MNVILVGMPGAGKSTIGILLAKRITFNFIDTDVNIQLETGESLQETINRDGYLRLREIEEEVLYNLNPNNSVVSTGGSAVYGPRAMDVLKSDGLVVFIKTDLSELKRRVSNYEKRGIARRPDHSFQDLFVERNLLYNKYADIVVNSVQGNQDSMVEDIVTALRKNGLELKHAI